MKEYLDLKHMELVPDSEINNINSLYLPHHGVVRNTSSTTKLRVVFDASSKTSSGLSLNDLLMVGPRVQPELFPILIQFRLFNIAICADVEKMFRQIKVHEEDVDWQRILWRESPNEPIKEYCLTTVTYGTSSAPFLSTRTLRQLAIDEQENFPAASRATRCHFYVDDLLSGSATKKEAIQLVSELQEMMKKGGFSLGKWVSNDPDVLATISKELQAIDSKHTINDDQPVKILGIAWLPDVDKFTFTITVNEMDVWTKQKVLSEVAKIFDPLGWLAPTVINSKIFLQELWSHHLSWDEELPDSLAKQWRTFQEQLPVLTNIKIPRCILIPQASDVQVHGFCDSSEKAYCAAIYIRSQDVTLAVTSRLLTSKTRVSPVKPQSLPRLELCSALLLANLLQATLPTLTVPISETFAWSDSKITLAWLKSEPRRWQPFVAHRVAQIQELTPNVHWNHVSSLENPADCGTRGIPPTKLEKCDFWFNGPDWLRISTFPNGGFEDNPELQKDMSVEAKGTSKLSSRLRWLPAYEFHKYNKQAGLKDMFQNVELNKKRQLEQDESGVNEPSGECVENDDNENQDPAENSSEDHPDDRPVKRARNEDGTISNVLQALQNLSKDFEDFKKMPKQQSQPSVPSVSSISDSTLTEEEIEILLKSQRSVAGLMKWAGKFERCQDGIRCQVCQSTISYDYSKGDDFTGEKENMPLAF
ncbi:uncharacterized protein LOC129226996 [Uloborus diversus]|uniref:uncharacterized protein LOC129226996 n=1 Tax=Uloborus diversus TaxID=327109 RepID=UPI00240A70E8|nr:uncharacterized protein LOC129226996 [Uloborus diversus]